jgi:hypothetical protein
MIVYPVSFMGSQGWQFSSTGLTWPGGPNPSNPTVTTGYTLYSGSYTSTLSGYNNTPITLPTQFYINNVASDELRIHVNGLLSIGSGFEVSSSLPGTFGGNTWYVCNASIFSPPLSLNRFTSGFVMEYGDTQAMWYKTGSEGEKHYAEAMFLLGLDGNDSFPQSFRFGFYRDSVYQWLMTQVRPRLGMQDQIRSAAGNGPYSVPSVSQLSSQFSKVWRGNLAGTSWTYMGTGSVV